MELAKHNKQAQGIAFQYGKHMSLGHKMNSDLQPFVKGSYGDPVSFSLNSAPVVLHRHVVGAESWVLQLQQVQAPPTRTCPRLTCTHLARPHLTSPPPASAPRATTLGRQVDYTKSDEKEARDRLGGRKSLEERGGEGGSRVARETGSERIECPAYLQRRQGGSVTVAWEKPRQRRDTPTTPPCPRTLTGVSGKQTCKRPGGHVRPEDGMKDIRPFSDRSDCPT
ncbi:hypothetical protein JZ751_003233 [Albula glossodonta]|uniref:Uncharacterized protein n=1 Tax=Albula glossodonta TaxID=121402 RepID=A0A8T2N953_9TELE|nr:hypothetical protein JZ751_003233 [Albula glossodonta]